MPLDQLAKALIVNTQTNERIPVMYNPEEYRLDQGNSFAEVGIDDLAERFQPERLVTVPATELAREHVGRPLPNAALLGAFAAVTSEIAVSSVSAAIDDVHRGRPWSS